MDKITYYQILWGQSTSDLAEKVNKDIQFGWIPLGGVCSEVMEITWNPNAKRNLLLQAMVKTN